MDKDFIYNGNAKGDVASRLLSANFDVGVLRPYTGADGKSYMTVNHQGAPKSVPITNATATLHKDDWLTLDKAIIKAAKPRLRFVGDLRAAGLTYNIPNGMGKTVLQSENSSDVNEAVVSMDGLRESPNDRPVFDLVNLPLPIIHKDFSYSARQIAASRSGGSPLDTTHAELAAAKVAEEAEKLAIGVSSSYSYGGGTIYGLTNFPNRLSVDIESPASSEWTPKTHLKEVLAMREASQDAYHYGSWNLYYSNKWDKYLDDDYNTNNPGETLRTRLQKIEGIGEVKTLDYLTDYNVSLCQMTSNVVREVIGMDVTTVQWAAAGGMKINFKVMAILVPQLRADQNGNTGIVHGSVVE